MPLSIFILIIYFLALFQASFVGFFDFQGYTLNLVLIFILFFNFFESPKSDKGFALAIFGGFFLDIFSSGLLGIKFLGFWPLILAVASLFIKYIFKKHIHLYG